MLFFCSATSFLLAVWFCIYTHAHYYYYTHAQLRILKFQDSLYQIAEVCAQNINEWSKSKRSVVLLRRQDSYMTWRKEKIIILQTRRNFLISTLVLYKEIICKCSREEKHSKNTNLEIFSVLANQLTLVQWQSNNQMCCQQNLSCQLYRHHLYRVP